MDERLRKHVCKTFPTATGRYHTLRVQLETAWKEPAGAR